MTKSAFAALLLTTLLLAPSACGEGYDTVDAEAECDRIRNTIRTCFEGGGTTARDPAYAACVDCFESCGNECFVDNCSFTCD